MKADFRKKQSFMSLGTVIIGLVCLWGITAGIHRIGAADSILPHSEAEVQEVQDTSLGLDIDEIYSGVKTSTENIRIEEVAAQLAAGTYLRGVTLKNKGTTIGVVLSYSAGAHELGLTKVKRDQMVLVNASILMSLYSEVDVVKFEVTRENEYYEKVIYRPDLNDYFGVRLYDVIYV